MFSYFRIVTRIVEREREGIALVLFIFFYLRIKKRRDSKGAKRHKFVIGAGLSLHYIKKGVFLFLV